VGVTRVLLLGFMASGKTTVGRLVADRLGWIHIDFDAQIEREQGMTVAQIFETRGEQAFREMEAAVTPRLLARSHAVLTPGGGWITNPALLEQVPPDTLTVWLRVSPGEVVRRVHAGGRPGDRPLLTRTGGEAGIVELLSLREPLYGRAQMTIDTTGRAPAELAAELVTMVRSNG
jgi:shikimate kinase